MKLIILIILKIRMAHIYRIRVSPDGINPIPNYTEEEDIVWFNKLSVCKCCERHQTDRPKTRFSSWKLMNTPPWQGIKSTCDCQCRMASRMLARKAQNIDGLIEQKKYEGLFGSM